MMPGSTDEESHRIKDTTIPIVNKAIVASKTLWPQRAIIPSILDLPVTNRKTPQLRERLQFRCTNMRAIRYSSTSVDVTESL
jgi:hypothetical protein